MVDIGAGDSDVAQHALVETCQMQPVPVPAVPYEERVQHRAQRGIECAQEAVGGLRTVRCRKRLASEVGIQLRNSIGLRSGFTASAKELVRCDMEFNRRIFTSFVSKNNVRKMFQLAALEIRARSPKFAASSGEPVPRPGAVSYAPTSVFKT